MRRVCFCLLLAGCLAGALLTGDAVWLGGLCLLAASALCSLTLLWLPMTRAWGPVRLRGRLLQTLYGEERSCRFEGKAPEDWPRLLEEEKHCGGLSWQVTAARRRDLLGLFSRKEPFPEERVRVNFPEAAELPEGVTASLLADDTEAGEKAGMPPAEPLAIRAWRQEEPASLIHPRLSARENRPLVLEWAAEAGTPLLLVMDHSRNGADKAAMDEAFALLRGAAEAALNRGQRLLMATLSMENDRPQRVDSPEALEDFLRQLLCRPLAERSVGRLPEGGRICLITTETGWVNDRADGGRAPAAVLLPASLHPTA